MIAGGWTKFRPLSQDELKIFNKAMESLVGVNYEPFAVSTQVVQGTNYKFLCNACVVTQPPREFTAQIVIFQPLPGTGEPVITHISEVL